MKIYGKIDNAVDRLFMDTGGPFNTIEPYNEQYQNTEDEQGTRYPAIYYELVDDLSWTQHGNGYQTATAKLRMHCVQKDVKRAKDSVIDLSEFVFGILHQKQLIDKDFEMFMSSPMCLINSSLPKRYGILKVIKLDFEMEVYNFLSLPEKQNFANGPFVVKILP